MIITKDCTKDCEYEDDPAKCYITESPIFRTAVQKGRRFLDGNGK